MIETQKPDASQTDSENQICGAQLINNEENSNDPKKERKTGKGTPEI